MAQCIKNRIGLETSVVMVMYTYQHFCVYRFPKTVFFTALKILNVFEEFVLECDWIFAASIKLASWTCLMIYPVLQYVWLEKV